MIFPSLFPLQQIIELTSFLSSVKPYMIKTPENVSAVAGDDVRLGCVVGGKPKPEIRWSR